ncbi:MAG TPA: carboxypeptidase-like regulatory domain-containing protein [Blastocatellia bacterium]|jgi:protocatechuate 3,4-dioxygenase beta subunit|nr:carboxypeptidase-like regulatory domain-containing protein [Blastocatellia bacterium]
MIRIGARFYRKTKLSGAACTTFLLSAGFIISNAQQGGTITGRVINDEGAGMPNVTVVIIRAQAGRRAASPRGNTQVVTDKDGKFRGAGLSPGLYEVDAPRVKEYVMRPLTAAESGARRYYRVGDSITITLMKGGVITGRVTNSDGQPMVGAEVSATIVRDIEGFSIREAHQEETQMTDDRGIYRIFGLRPGSYIVGTNGNIFESYFSPYAGSAMTYHPSSTHDTATEVAVASGAEASGIDIQFRGGPGYVVSGTVTTTSATLASGRTIVSLVNTDISAVTGSAYVRPNDPRKGFMIQGLNNGNYEIVAYSYGDREIFASSAPRRITVSGGDVTGLELKISPLASVSGQALVEASSNSCGNKSKRAMEEIMIYARSDDPSVIASSDPHFFGSDADVNEKGEFAIHSLRPSRYHFEASLPDESWYTRSITIPATAAARQPKTLLNLRDISRAGLEIKSGDEVTGVMVWVAEGAASLRGKVVAEKEGASLPSRLRVHLAPVDAALANEVLRYSEALVSNDGSFAFNNLAPGKYWLLARPVPYDEPADRPPKPASWDSAERAKLRMEAEKKKIEVELNPCQRLKDFSFKF